MRQVQDTNLPRRTEEGKLNDILFYSWRFYISTKYKVCSYGTSLPLFRLLFLKKIGDFRVLKGRDLILDEKVRRHGGAVENSEEYKNRLERRQSTISNYLRCPFSLAF